MDEQWQEQEERENLSGADLCEAWHEEIRAKLDEFERIRLKMIARREQSELKLKEIQNV